MRVPEVVAGCVVDVLPEPVPPVEVLRTIHVRDDPDGHASGRGILEG